jgi:hypothetical protein
LTLVVWLVCLLVREPSLSPVILSEVRFKKQVLRHDDDPRLKGQNGRTQINRWKSSGAIPGPVREAQLEGR